MKKYVLVLSDELQTLSLGATLASVCVQGCLIYLNGYIGSGKSVFCKGFLHALGHIGHINSPTYTLVESYMLTHWRVYHFDFYRLISSEELECMGIRDYFDDHTICLVEWPKQGMGILPKEDISITINYHDRKNFRQVIIESSSNVGHKMCDDLLACWKLDI
ncbi:tRNA (adenosine(37)-N6)-threonylcarbamoyltransferase complex ATPase subunit type 1 TsaE [Blochmannia endosymbiont of Camponotus sp. C-003]|uniref:tRNA (adenosine(37)-N6)-threonylcarbamoyltransferase complex ATPase subunit type 1 TsaE n=1 Tax=unclassified Candidatus Blochmanniella TaxID=711328 RepID=UPI002023DCAE|nr:MULTISPECIES: tRNA (adenosine(37)-N6)-threonylcarbamoyltransferase complex ATPase subunit type 1 TsaE [unclassified Candidatus Blochmannia]URJ23606.1 tRNA (adenosine(37)-N6)-threonylcarbamoyltransferase complex ATPase subunit type 1 TsaE [Blochmannia endosymbiont of Camponotus sp. C-003]URJ29051.1 tRNA (adenosine(37)-N6)-threonylcarbamoyltransferase complex ATPase subunit type 1 TsaE [Blochmannia endosymbiont of Camponotus sp. C-046]